MGNQPKLDHDDHRGGEGALQTRVGESTLIVHLAANRDSYPRIVGALADWYWSGSFHATPERDVEVGHVRAGTGTAALYQWRQPGTYIYATHRLTEAFVLGATAQFDVDGEWNDALMKQVHPAHPVP